MGGDIVRRYFGYEGGVDYERIHMCTVDSVMEFDII